MGKTNVYDKKRELNGMDPGNQSTGYNYQARKNAYDYKLQQDAQNAVAAQNAQIKNQPTQNPLTQKGGFGSDVIITDNKPASGGGDNGGGGGGGYETTKYGAFQPSQTYLKAMEYTNNLLQQMSSGRTSYTDQINSLMNQIQNRNPFSYDADRDTLFQNSLQSAMRDGKIAMQDTMGQAASLTGGYGSTYATSAANQAYNGYIQDAYANLPDYYNLALEAYNMEGQNLQNQLGMYMDADNTEYNRLANAYSANMQNAANMYDREYNNYWQTAKMNEDARQFNANMAYRQSQDAQSQSNWEKEYQLSMAKAANSGNENAPKLTDKQYQTAVGLFEQYGDDDDSEYAKYVMNLYEQGYDISELEYYVKSKQKGNKALLNSISDSWNNIF